MMIKQSFAIALACLAFTAACNRGEGSDVASPATQPAAGTKAADASVAAAAPTPIAAEKPFMMKTFAGTFSAGGNTITLNADGSYTSGMKGTLSDGTWTADADGSELLLDPNSKSESDRRYTVVSSSEIRGLDDGVSLQREGSGK